MGILKVAICNHQTDGQTWAPFVHSGDMTGSVGIMMPNLIIEA